MRLSKISSKSNQINNKDSDVGFFLGYFLSELSSLVNAISLMETRNSMQQKKERRK